MTPEPYPTPWRWVDLGLPSGTLWLDRNVGANSPQDPGLYFMWGQKFGHRADSGYSFDSEAYTREGLNLIGEDITTNNDGASLYYGDSYRMPTLSQIEELMQGTSVEEKEGYINLVSNTNGSLIKIPKSGFIDGTEIKSPDSYRISCRTYYARSTCHVLVYDITGLHVSDTVQRIRGVPIRPVYNR